MTLNRLAPTALVAVAIAVAGCAPSAPDYQSIWSTGPTTTTTTTTPPGSERPVPISTYLETIGITGTPVDPSKLTDLTVTMPTPAGWAPYKNPKQVAGTRVIAKGSGYPNATLVTYRFNGIFDIPEALKHADAEAEVSENFTKLNGSAEKFGGFPSSMIEGSYDFNGQRMQTYSRIVFATGTPGPQPGAQGAVYLIQLTVTSFENEAAANGPDIESIIKGFSVAAKK